MKSRGLDVFFEFSKNHKIILSFKKKTFHFIYYCYYFENGIISSYIHEMKCLCASFLNSKLLKLGDFCPFSLVSSLYKVPAEVLFETL